MEKMGKEEKLKKLVKGYSAFETITFIDVETDGLEFDPENDNVSRIISISATKTKNKEIIGTFFTFVKSDRHIQKIVTELTKICDDDLKNAPNVYDALTALYEFCKGSVQAYYCSPFTLRFLNYYSKDIDICFEEMIDVYHLARIHLNEKMERFIMISVATYYGFYNDEWEKLKDSEKIAKIFFKICEEINSSSEE